MQLDINMFGQTIKSGYIVKVTAWENDADDYSYTVINGLTEKEVSFYKEWLTGYISCSSGGMGNDNFNFIKAITHLHSLRDKYMEEIDSQLDIDLYDVDSIELALEDKNFVEYNKELLYNAIEGILGRPVQYYGDFVRVFDGLDVYLLKEDVVIPKLKKVKSN
jgi:hypothetical protein